MALPEQLLASDFDGTTHLTSEPAPNGMTVQKAYEQGIEQVFGSDALERYKYEGGLRNRAPFEITKQLLPDVDIDGQRVKTEDLIAAKLAVLLDQVGMRIDETFWPRLNDGFKDLWVPASAERAITTGIISSGHEDFIRKAYEVHDLAPPDLFVTDDHMRPLLEHLPAEMCVKPSRLLLDTLHSQWLERRGILGVKINDPLEFQAGRGQIVYAGDDVAKDRNLAANAGVRFVHINPENPVVGFHRLGKALGLSLEVTYDS